MVRILRRLVVTLFAIGLVACEQVALPAAPVPPVSSPVTAEFTVAPTALPTPTLGPSPSPLAANLPALVPTRSPSLVPTPVTAAPATRSTQTTVLPTVPSEGWDTNSLLVGPGKPGRLYALQGDRDARYFTSAKRRLLQSDDVGDTWRPFAGGLPVAPDCMVNLDLDYATVDALYASTCHGLYRWSGDKWTLVSAQETRQVAIVYGRPQEIWASVSPQKAAAVLHSSDGGKTWQRASDGLMHFNGLANLAIDPRDAKTVYGIIMPKYGGSYLRRLFVGNTWQTLPTPLDNRQIDTGMTIDGATGDLYVTTFKETGWQLWRTRNPQASDEKAIVWEKVYDFPPGLWATVLASGGTGQGLALFVRLAPSNCNAYDAQCDPFVERSVDGGKTWRRLVIH